MISKLRIEKIINDMLKEGFVDVVAGIKKAKLSNKQEALYLISNSWTEDQIINWEKTIHKLGQ